MEVKSENITMQANVETVSGKVMFPSQQQSSNEIDLSKIVPSGDENSCFVFRDRKNSIVGRIGIRSDAYPVEIRYNAVEGDNYTEEIFALWISWIFSNTDIKEICDLIVGNSPERVFVEQHFQERSKLGNYGTWFYLEKEDWM